MFMSLFSQCAVCHILLGNVPNEVDGKRGVRSAECGVWKRWSVENAECVEMHKR